MRLDLLLNYLLRKNEEKMRSILFFGEKIGARRSQTSTGFNAPDLFMRSGAGNKERSGVEKEKKRNI